jgi:hypothetical protein
MYLYNHLLGPVYTYEGKHMTFVLLSLAYFNIMMKNSMDVPQETKNRYTIWSNDNTPEYIPEGILARISQSHLYTYIHFSTLHGI